MDLGALELAATVEAGRDLLDGARALERWLAARGIQEPGLSLRLADFRALRAAIRTVLAAALEGRPVPPDSAAALNAASAAAPVHPRLEIHGGVAHATQVEAGPAAARVFASLAR